jgi:hypothetical protein
MKKTTLVSFCAAALVAMLATTAHATTATILYATDFNGSTHTPFSSPSTTNSFTSASYTDGAIIGQDGWAITGTSTTNPIMVANTATNGNVTLATTGQDVNRVASGNQGAQSGSVFMSADITVTSANATGDYFMHMGDGTSTDFYDRLFVKAGTDANTFQMALATSSGTPASTAYGAELNTGSTYHIVGEYDFNPVAGTTNDTATLFVNPSDSIVGGGTPYMTGVTQGTDAITISSINLRQGSTGPIVTVDNIALAATNPVTVPEPTTLVLSGLGLIGLIGFGRRKRS